MPNAAEGHSLVLWICSKGAVVKNLALSAPVPGRDTLTPWSSQSDKGGFIVHGQPW